MKLLIILMLYLFFLSGCYNANNFAAKLNQIKTEYETIPALVSNKEKPHAGNADRYMREQVKDILKQYDFNEICSPWTDKDYAIIDDYFMRDLGNQVILELIHMKRKADLINLVAVYCPERITRYCSVEIIIPFFWDGLENTDSTTWEGMEILESIYKKTHRDSIRIEIEKAYKRAFNNLDLSEVEHMQLIEKCMHWYKENKLLLERESSYMDKIIAGGEEPLFRIKSTLTDMPGGTTKE